MLQVRTSGVWDLNLNVRLISRCAGLRVNMTKSNIKFAVSAIAIGLWNWSGLPGQKSVRSHKAHQGWPEHSMMTSRSVAARDTAFWSGFLFKEHGQWPWKGGPESRRGTDSLQTRHADAFCVMFRTGTTGDAPVMTNLAAGPARSESSTFPLF